MKKLLTLEFLPLNSDLGLLILRVVFGLSLLWFHGWGKLTRLLSGSAAVPDVLGIGAMPTTVLAVFAEIVCATLVTIGLWTRFASVFVVATTGCAFVLAHKMAITGMHNGEMPLLFLAAYLTILLAGPGRYSFDRK